MLTMLMLLAISEPPTPSIETKPVLPEVGADLIPGPPALPSGLPDRIAVDTPVRGTLLPYPRDVAVGKLVRYCIDEYPRVVGAAVANVRSAEQAACNGRLSVERMQCRAAGLRQDAVEASAWTSWEVAGLTVGVGVVAMAAGFLAGHLK